MSCWLIMLMVLGRMLYTHGKRLCFKHKKKNCGNNFLKIVQHGQIYFLVSPWGQLKVLETHLYYHFNKMNIKEIKWGLDTFMVKEKQKYVILATNIIIIVVISTMAQWYRGYRGLSISFCINWLKLKIHSSRRQADIKLLTPYLNQWRRFLFKLIEKLKKTLSNKNNYYHHMFHYQLNQHRIIIIYNNNSKLATM